MKKILSVLMIFAVTAFSSGCGATDEESVFEPIYLDVEISIDPEKGEVGEKIIFEAFVTYGNEPVRGPRSQPFL